MVARRPELFQLCEEEPGVGRPALLGEGSWLVGQNPAVTAFVEH